MITKHENILGINILITQTNVSCIDSRLQTGFACTECFFRAHALAYLCPEFFINGRELSSAFHNTLFQFGIQPQNFLMCTFESASFKRLPYAVPPGNGELMMMNNVKR